MKLVLLFSIALIAFLNLGNFLDVTAEPVKSDVIFCLGGLGTDRVSTAIDLLENGYSSYNKLYYSGNKNSLINNVKDLNITYISYLGNTMGEILYIDNLVEKEKYSSVIIITDPPHSRRVSFMINQFSKNLKGKYIVVSSNPKWWHSEFYFLNYKAVIFSIKEIGKLFYNYLKYTLKFIFDPKFVKRFNEVILKNENFNNKLLTH